MKFFVDTANVEHIKNANDIGVICGVTTNPSLIAKEGRDFNEVIKEITSIVDGPISGEVKATTVDAEGMIKEGREIAAIHPNMVVKIPMTVEGLKAVKVLSSEGIKTNVTLIFSANQAILAANAGATYVSPFLGRLDDISQPGIELIRQISEIFDIYGYDTEIIAASIRNPIHVTDCALAGADIATIPNKLIAFEKEEIKNTFGEYLAANGKKQLRLAETEKYAHVTFFFNGGVEEPNIDEARLLVNSPKDVATYDLKPEMSAPEVGMDLVEAIKSDKYDVIIINFANPDMVGHTGVIPAAVKAVERVDSLVGDAVQAIKDVDGVLFICADHGNAEKMIDYETGKPHTAHTTNPVPFILVNADPSYKLREGGCLADIAPTLLEIMGLPQPKEMTGKSLIVK